MEYKISIIVPCYNVEKYIVRCINSLINQTIGIESLQIIFVNDASTDSTLSILSEYEAKYPNNICIINLETNSGLSCARNAALDYAYAPFIGYVDADDWIELDMFEKMFCKITEYNCDVVMCRNDRPKSESEAKSGVTGKDLYFVLDRIENKKIFLSYFRLDVTCWNKLVRKQLLIDNNISFPEKLKYEDNYWSILLFLYAKSMYLLEECLYHWFLNPRSIVTSGTSNIDRTSVQLMLIEECKKRLFLDDYAEELEYNFYEKFFVETIFFLFRDNDVTVHFLNKLKSILLKYSNLEQNAYYKCERPIVKLKCETEIRKLLENDITEELAEQVMKKCFL